MGDNGIGNLIEPVDTIERQTCEHYFFVLFMDFRSIDVEYDSQNKDKCPIEIFRASDTDAVHKSF